MFSGRFTSNTAAQEKIRQKPENPNPTHQSSAAVANIAKKKIHMAFDSFLLFGGSKQYKK
jgi:hypothetical protein